MWERYEKREKSGILNENNWGSLALGAEKAKITNTIFKPLYTLGHKIK